MLVNMESILILHGWGIGSKTWVQVKDTLESRGFKVYVPDLPGFGESIPPSKPWSIDDYVNWVKQYTDNLQARGEISEPFFLLGHSFGGSIAVKFMNNFSGMVKGLILVAPKLRRQKTIRYYGGLALAKIGRMVFYIPPLFFLRPLAQKLLYKLIGTMDYYKLELEKVNIMKETLKEVVGANLIPYLSAIKVPTLIVWGKKDHITPLKDAYLANKEIEGSKLEIIENGRHALNLEVPEILAEKIIKFLENR